MRTRNIFILFTMLALHLSCMHPTSKMVLPILIRGLLLMSIPLLILVCCILQPIYLMLHQS